MAQDTLEVGGQRMPLTHPDKVLFGDAGLTKAQLVAYYRTVAGTMLPHLAGRPVMLERYPDGIDGDAFYQKRVGRHFPDWVERYEVTSDNGPMEHVACGSDKTLVYLATQATITLHPWLSRADRPDQPDRVVWDLDPSDGDFAAVCDAAHAVAGCLRELELEPFVQTTGSRGLHVMTPIQRRYDADEVRRVARAVAVEVASRDEARLTVEPRKDKRAGRVYLDVMRNGRAQTAVAPYSVRARPTAPVATPLTWEELDEGDVTPTRFTVADIPGRLERLGDPWADAGSHARPFGTARRWAAAQMGT